MTFMESPLAPAGSVEKAFPLPRTDSGDDASRVPEVLLTARDPHAASPCRFSDRLRSPYVRGAILIAVLTALYAPGLPRYFVSEDFVLLRYLDTGTWRDDVLPLFRAPWLGVIFVRFYRPVSTALLGLEYELFGTASVAYGVVHLLVHLTSVLLVFRCAVRLFGDRRSAAPFWVAILFGIHPLHPNTVLFIGSFAPLFSIAFLLASLLAFLRARETGGFGARLPSLLCYALALGSYEAAVVLPLLLLATDLLLPRSAAVPKSGSGIARLAATHHPYLAITAVYLLLRFLVFGVLIGGYTNLDERLREWQPSFLGEAMLSCWRLVVPSWEGGEWVPGGTGIGLGLLTLAVVAGLARRFGPERRCAALVLLALVWIVVSQIPFSFTEIVPARGRYLYLASIGSAVGLVALLRGLAGILRLRRSGIVVGVPAALLSLVWGGELAVSMTRHVEAAQITRGLQAQAVEEARRCLPDTVLFLINPPDFVASRDGTPVAQVYSWGLSDAVRPPFVERRIPLYTLPRVSWTRLLPVVRGLPDAHLLWWEEATHTLEPRPLRSEVRRRAAALPEVAVRGPEDGACLPPLATGWEVVFRAEPGCEYTFFAIGAMPAVTIPIDETIEAGEDGWVTAPINGNLQMAALYDDPVWWWIEARDATGEAVAGSALRRLVLE